MRKIPQDPHVGISIIVRKEEREINLGMTMGTACCGFTITKPTLVKKLNYQTCPQPAVVFFFFFIEKPAHFGF